MCISLLEVDGYTLREGDWKLIVEQPKQKPLRVKRGRRAPDFMAHEMHAHTSQDDGADGGHAGDALERDRPDYEARLASGEPHDVDTSRIGKQRKPESGFDVFANELHGPLSVNNRRAIAAGTYDVGQDILRKWREQGPEEQARFNRRFREGDYAVPDSNGQSFARSNVDGAASDGEEGRVQKRDVDMAEDDGYEDRD